MTSSSQSKLLQPSPIGMDDSIASRLAQGFIRFCMEDGENASRDVTSRLANIQMELVAAQDKLATEGADKDAIIRSLADIQRELNEATIAMQFYDRLSQRMDHSIQCLKMLRETPSYTEAEAKVRQQAALTVLYNALTMEDERVLYRAIERGEAVEEAVRQAAVNLDQGSAHGSDDIELF